MTDTTNEVAFGCVNTGIGRITLERDGQWDVCVESSIYSSLLG